MKIRNHYLPVCYLKGFTDKDELFYVYDKVTGQIRRDRDKPKNVFYEKYKFAVKFYHEHEEELKKIQQENPYLQAQENFTIDKAADFLEQYFGQF